MAGPCDEAVDLIVIALSSDQVGVCSRKEGIADVVQKPSVESCVVPPQGRGEVQEFALLFGLMLRILRGPTKDGLSLQGSGWFRFCMESHTFWSGRNECGVLQRLRAVACLS